MNSYTFQVFYDLEQSKHIIINQYIFIWLYYIKLIYTFNSSMQSKPTIIAVVVAIAGIILPAINLLYKKIFR